MADKIDTGRTSWLLVDNFVGAISDFADTTVVDVFASRSAAVHEVKARIRNLELCHKEFFKPHEITLPTNREIELELRKADCVKYCSSDGCRYSWQLFRIAS